MKRLSRRLILPVQPLLVSERLHVVSSRNLPLSTRPPLLSFSGDDFVEEFLALANRENPADSMDLPPLFAWRDWSEPPEELLTAQGETTYPSSTMRREPPLGLKDGTSGGPGDLRDPDGVPSADGPLAPPWLRKLYLPQHERFTLVSVDVVCQRHGQPWLDRKRVKEAGMIVRRLRAGTQTSRECWEDWFPSGDGEGSWQERFDADLSPQGLPVDSSSGLDPIEAGLGSHRLRLIPADPDPQRLTPCRLYGYLPVFSAERQRSPDPGLSISAWRQRTQRRLEALRPLVANLTPAQDILQRLMQNTILPERPSATEIDDSRQNIRSFVLGMGGVAPHFDEADIDQAINIAVGHLLVKAILRLGSSALDSDWFLGDVKQTCADGPQIWTIPPDNAAEAVSLEYFDNDLKAALSREGLPEFLFDPLQDSGTANGVDWDLLVRSHLHLAVDRHVVSPIASDLSPEEWDLLLASALVRARGHLLALAVAIQVSLLATSLDASSTPEQLQEQWNASIPDSDASGTAPAALYSMAALLEWVTLLPLEKEVQTGSLLLNGQGLSIGSGSQTDRIFDVLECLLALKQRLDPVVLKLSEAGSMVRLALADQAEAKQAHLLERIGITPETASLASLGVPLGESPAQGLLLFPGSHPTQAALDALKQQTLARDGPNGLVSAAEIRSLERSTQLRYDSRHLYAAWCWVRVSGRSPCEQEQVIWSQRSEPFRIADPLDLLGSRPVALSMPDLPKLVKDLGRLVQARAKPFASVRTPPQSGFSVGEDLIGISRRFGLGGSCSFGIPVFTICALVLFYIVFNILSVILQWLPSLQVCTPSPEE